MYAYEEFWMGHFYKGLNLNPKKLNEIVNVIAGAFKDREEDFQTKLNGDFRESEYENWYEPQHNYVRFPIMDIDLPGDVKGELRIRVNPCYENNPVGPKQNKIFVILGLRKNLEGDGVFDFLKFSNGRCKEILDFTSNAYQDIIQGLNGWNVTFPEREVIHEYHIKNAGTNSAKRLTNVFRSESDFLRVLREDKTSAEIFSDMLEWGHELKAAKLTEATSLYKKTNKDYTLLMEPYYGKKQGYEEPRRGIYGAYLSEKLTEYTGVVDTNNPDDIHDLVCYRLVLNKIDRA